MANSVTALKLLAPASGSNLDKPGLNLDTVDITVTSNGANLHGGTIQDTTVTGLVHAWGVIDGTGNTNVAHESSIGPGANVGTGIGMAA